MTCSASPWREHLRNSYKVERKVFSRWRYGVRGRERGHGKGLLKQDMRGNRETQILCSESLSPPLLPIHRMYGEQDVTRNTDKVILCRFLNTGPGSRVNTINNDNKNNVEFVLSACMVGMATIAYVILLQPVTDEEQSFFWNITMMLITLCNSFCCLSLNCRGK